MAHFRQCKNCGTIWQSRDAFIDDPSVKLIGFQVYFEDPDRSFLLMNHVPGDGSCQTTLAESIGTFMDLYDGQVFPEVHKGGEHCEGHCLYVYNVSRCDAPCRNAMVRRVMQILLDRHRVACEQVGIEPVTSAPVR